MSEKEYIVSLHRNVNYIKFNNEMIATTGAGAIPARSVDVANARPGSYRNTHYSLTDDEAEALRDDPRVAGVELRPEDRDDIELGRFNTQTGDFTKTASDSGPFLNWGLRRINETVNPYVGNTVTGGYNYTLDGSNVDIVIQDSGIQFGHPEFNDEQGNERLQRINWYTEAGVPGTQPGGFYSDYDGHGTHCAGIAAGLNYGWGKNANIYAMKLSGLEGPSDPNAGIPVSEAFDLIKLWHRNKPINPDTGYKNPTVVNMSWGYFSYFLGVTGGVYQGTPWVGGPTRDTDKGMVGAYRGSQNVFPLGVTDLYSYPIRLVSVDTDIQEMIDEGIHVCIAAGNSYQKIDIPGGKDYDNYYTSSYYSGNRYYHRGGSPYDDEAHVVGNVDSEIHAGGKEQKAVSSETGPGVHIYAPGTNIMSASSNTNIYVSDSYSFGNPFYQQMNISGTSMASPQVAGVLALYLQLNPSATPKQAKDWLLNFAQDDKLYDTPGDEDYTVDRSLLGGNNKFVYNKFNSSAPFITEYPNNQTFEIVRDVDEINEGGSVTFTLNTENVPDLTEFTYTVTGVSSEDINGDPLTGTFRMFSNTDSVSFTTSLDLKTEGLETLKITLDNGEAENAVFIRDTSTLSNAPSYSVDASSKIISEGQTVRITLRTTNVDEGEVVPYTISGVSSADISSASLTGNFTVGADGTDDFVLTTSVDQTTEGTETMVVTLDTGEKVSIQILDTSQSPTYSLVASSSVVDEGVGFTITLTTTDVFDGTVVPFSIFGVTSGDIDGTPLNGSFTIFSGTADVSFTTTKDLTTEGDETFTLSLDNGGALIQVDISDVSPNRPTGNTYSIAVSPQGNTSYEVAGNDANGPLYGFNADININYGDTISFNISSNNHPFWIKTAPSLGSLDAVNNVSNNGTQFGFINWTPDAIGTFFYQSGANLNLGGRIIIS